MHLLKRLTYLGLFFVHLVAHAQETIRINIDGKDGATSSVVEIVQVASVEAAFNEIAKSADDLANTNEIVIADDFANEHPDSRSNFLQNPKFTRIPLHLREKVTAVETIAQLERENPDGRYEDLTKKAQEVFDQKEADYKRLRLPVTIVKGIGVGVVTYFLYYSKFDYQFLPTVLWAFTTGALAAGFQWKAPEINNDYRVITDAFFNKYKPLKRFAVPEFDDGSGEHKIRHRIVKKLGVMVIGGWRVTRLYHLLTIVPFYIIAGTLARDTLLDSINGGLFHFSSLTLSALAVGFASNVLILSVKELLADVAPSCYLSSWLQNRNFSPETKRVGMALGSAVIGGISSILVLASQFLPFPEVKIAVAILTVGGAAYYVYKYALKEIFTRNFLHEMINDFDSEIARGLLAEHDKYLDRKRVNDQLWERARAQSIQSESSAATQHHRPRPAPEPAKHTCKIYLVSPPPKTFLAPNVFRIGSSAPRVSP